MSFYSKGRQPSCGCQAQTDRVFSPCWGDGGFYGWCPRGAGGVNSSSGGVQRPLPVLGCTPPRRDRGGSRGGRDFAETTPSSAGGPVAKPSWGHRHHRHLAFASTGQCPPAGPCPASPPAPTSFGPARGAHHAVSLMAAGLVAHRPPYPRR